MDDPLLPIILFVALALLSGFLTAAEGVLRTHSVNALKKRADDGDKTAARLLPLARHPRSTSTALRTIVTIATLSAAAMGISGACALAETMTGSVPSGSLVGALWVGVILAVTILTVGLNALFRHLLVGHHGASEASEDEIRMLMDMGEEKGAIETGEKEMIENIFDFNNTTAEDVMIHRTDMVLLWAEDTTEEITHTIEESGLSRFPVCDNDADDVVGVLSTREFLLNARREHPQALRDLLRPAYFVPESVRTDLLFRDMQSKKVHMAIVVDEYGGTSGLVTMEDLLEEIVGDIYDEFDPTDEAEIIPIGENLWRVAGSAELEEIAELLEVDLSGAEEYDTLAGLVFAQLSVIPENGSHVEVDACGLHIKVETLNDRRIEWAEVSKHLPGGTEEN